MAVEARNSAARPDLVRALRSAAFAGLVAFGLFLPLIGFRAVQNIRNELMLEPRWPLFAAFVASAFVSRLIWALLPRDRLKQELAIFFRSPVKLAAAAGACKLAATALRIAAAPGSGPKPRSRSRSPICWPSARSYSSSGPAWRGSFPVTRRRAKAAAAAATRSAPPCAWARSGS